MSLDILFRIDAANDYRAIDTLGCQLEKLDPDNTQEFMRYIFRLLKLHRSFYQKAVQILLTDWELSDPEEIVEFKKLIREEQKWLIRALRTFKKPKNFIERLSRVLWSSNKSIEYLLLIQKNVLMTLFPIGGLIL